MNPPRSDIAKISLGFAGYPNAKQANLSSLLRS